MKTVRVNDTVFRYDFVDNNIVIITVPSSSIETATPGRVFVEIPMAEMKAFIGHYLRTKSIENFERMSDDDMIDWSVMGYHDTDVHISPKYDDQEVGYHRRVAATDVGIHTNYH